ncbi:MAG: hypothetical protein C0469_07735 [Cyanobacteria bacterium DS2.3.42]|nr:hypothetical protein [Cyanobacteria bacterium DS2.3.42]
MSDEKSVRDKVRVGASKAGACTFANPSGKGWQGKAKGLPDKSVIIPNARRVAYGLGVANNLPGSPDLVGWLPIVITPEMVGKKIAVFVGIECKDQKDVEPEQEKWLLILQRAGALCGVACNEEDAHRIVTGEKIYDPKTDNKASSRNRARKDRSD